MSVTLSSDEFEQELRDALAHLYDPAYQPTEQLCSMLGIRPPCSALVVQSAILRNIQGLKPNPGTPLTAYLWRVYEVLHCRYVLKLTQEETAEHLHMSLSSVQRAQRDATHAFAASLWERYHVADADTPERPNLADASLTPSAGAHGENNADGAQIRQEFAALRASDPNSMADIPETLRGILELQMALVGSRQVRLEVGYVQAGLIAAIHPSALRQTLIAAVGRLIRYAAEGSTITMFARLTDGKIRITVSGTCIAEMMPLPEDLTHDVLVPAESNLEARIEGSHAFLWVSVPCLGQVSVLVIDDNPDIVQFYRRCTTGTLYRILSVTSGEEAWLQLPTTRPDVIVLDVMLPDVDGWQLLMQLHENTQTRSIPIIVSSVVREESLALALGATLCLAKPVEPRRFVEALDLARLQKQAEGPQARPNTSVLG
jgi:CheY-like chemotaxis protein